MAIVERGSCKRCHCTSLLDATGFCTDCRPQRYAIKEGTPVYWSPDGIPVCRVEGLEEMQPLSRCRVSQSPPKPIQLPKRQHSPGDYFRLARRAREMGYLEVAALALDHAKLIENVPNR